MNNTTNSWEGFDALIRDITAQGFMAKSEARRRFNLIIAQAHKEAQKEFDAWKEGELDRAMKIREVAKREAREECIGIVDEEMRRWFELADIAKSDEIVARAMQEYEAAKRIKKRLEALTKE